MDENKTELQEKVIKKVEAKLDTLINGEIRQDNVDYIYKLVDIHKDMVKEIDMLEKEGEDDMNYRGYRGSYSGGRSRDARGRFTEGSQYGRRYKGHDYIDEMAEHYGAYSESNAAYGRGNYGAKEDSIKSLEYMLYSVEDFMRMLFEDAKSQEEIDLIKKTARKISDM